MQTDKTTQFTRKHFIISTVISLLLCLLQKRFVPQTSQSDFNRESAQWGIVFLSLAGGYVICKTRDSDLEYYRAKLPITEEAARALQQRRRKIGLVGGGLITLGSVYLAVLLIRLTNR